MNAQPSRWRDDEVWQERLEADAAFLEEALQGEGLGTLAAVRDLVEARLGTFDFLVVFGSRVAGRARPDSDVDVCFEAEWVPADPERMTRIRERQNELVFDLMGFPRGLFRGRLSVSDEVAVEIARDGRIYFDSGSYRDALIARDEERRSSSAGRR